ncbi:uncharacterized protein LOC124887787 [Capsicum annuum]|uniref:uncharacterized protein LOC124887787 n=1 Tax=Capsicum annuum TaxID=4072 RepID=UPI001FB13318|nr:uncharacterized protein LOC124887787 [Capsicum annuum]
MTVENHAKDGMANVAVTIIPTSSRSIVAPAMAPIEKSKKFSNVNFKSPLELSEECFIVTEAWKHSNFSDLWDALEMKYKSEDAGMQKFIIARFLHFKMTDSKTVISQVQELQVIIHDLLAEGLIVNEAFQVAAIIEKLPLLWKDFKNYLKHKRKEMSVEDLIVRLRIEEDNKVAEKSFRGNSSNSGANIVEDDPINQRKERKRMNNKAILLRKNSKEIALLVKRSKVGPA